MRIVIDLDLCEGNARCEQTAPEIFRVGDDDIVELLDTQPPEALREKIELAIQRCPRQALRLDD